MRRYSSASAVPQNRQQWLRNHGMCGRTDNRGTCSVKTTRIPCSRRFNPRLPQAICDRSLAKILQRGLEHSPDIPEVSYHELCEDTVPFRVVLAHGAGAAAASRVRSQRMAVRHLLGPSNALLRNIRYLVRKARRQYFEIHWRNSLCLILTSLKQGSKGHLRTFGECLFNAN